MKFIKKYKSDDSFAAFFENEAYEFQFNLDIDYRDQLIYMKSLFKILCESDLEKEEVDGIFDKKLKNMPPILYEEVSQYRCR